MTSRLKPSGGARPKSNGQAPTSSSNSLSAMCSVAQLGYAIRLRVRNVSSATNMSGMTRGRLWRKPSCPEPTRTTFQLRETSRSGHRIQLTNMHCDTAIRYASSITATARDETSVFAAGRVVRGHDRMYFTWTLDVHVSRVARHVHESLLDNMRGLRGAIT